MNFASAEEQFERVGFVISRDQSPLRDLTLMIHGRRVELSGEDWEVGRKFAPGGPLRFRVYHAGRTSPDPEPEAVTRELLRTQLSAPYPTKQFI